MKQELLRWPYMKTVCEKNMCSGCMACVDICSKSAIDMAVTMEAYNAVINQEKCVDCGLCQNVCPVNKKPIMRKPVQWVQGWAKDADVRKNGSSGGYAGAMARAFLASGGTVCSCVLKNGEFVFSIAETDEDLEGFSGSKYIKSNPGGIYKEIRKKLMVGRRVLFIGLPCQVAALQNYVGDRNRGKLYTVDLVCHGTPAPEVLEIFLKQHGIDLQETSDIRFRKKGKFQIWADGCAVGTEGVVDSYMIAFLNAATYTENCYHCEFAALERCSDLTLGDSWGSDLLQQNYNNGVSLCLCQTQKGQELMEMAELQIERVDIENAIRNNRQLNAPSAKPIQRKRLMQILAHNRSVDRGVLIYYPIQSIRQATKKALICLGLWNR